MKKCSDCPRVVRHLRKGFCNTCYCNHRNKLIAYNRWESSLIDAAETHAHILALLKWQMSTQQIGRLANMGGTTLRKAMRSGASGGKVAQETERRVGR